MNKILLLTILFPVFLFAQDDSTETPKKFIKVVSINGYLGGEFYREGFEDRTAFQQASPNSTLAFADISGYSNDNNIYYYFNSRVSVNSGMNVNLRLKGQKHSEVRIGIQHQGTNFASQSYNYETTTHTDTTFLPGGEALYTDSVAYSSYNYMWSAEVINLHVGWIVRSNPRNWMSVYTGLGLFAGIGFNGVLDYSHVHSSYNRHYNPQGGQNYTTNYQLITNVQESSAAPNFTSVGAYIPIGVTLRLGRRNAFLKHVAVYGEYNGAVQLLAPKNVNSKLRTVSSFYGGVRWYIHAPGGNFRGKHRPHPKHRID